MPKKTKTGKNRLDKYYHMAKSQGFRSRASFKLIQLNKKFNFLAKARVLVDLCAAPGSWLQVCAKYMPASRILIGVDLDKIKPIPGVITMVQDITTQECQREIKKHIGNSDADVVLHDGAPNVGANWVKDAFSQSELVLAALKLTTQFLAKGGTFVTKIFRSADYNTLNWVFSCLFKKVTATKPSASRDSSAEIFVVCEGYLKPAKIDPQLLNPKHVFKEIATAKNVDVFAKKPQRRNREGYDTDKQIVHKRCDVLDFIFTKEPLRILAECNEISWNPDPSEAMLSVERDRDEEDDVEERGLYKQHPKTTEEILECLKDLKLLSAKDFKLVLKWRLAMREFSRIDVDESKVVPEIELTEEQKENLIQQEMDDKMKQFLRQKKRKMIKKKKQAAKFQLRQGLGQTNLADEFDAPTEGGLFNLGGIKSSKLLEQLLGPKGKEYGDYLATTQGDVADLDLMDDHFNLLQEEPETAPNENELSFEDKEKREARIERYFDLLYKQVIETRDSKARRKRQFASRKGEQPEDLEDYIRDRTDNPMDLEEYSDQSDEENPNELNLEPKMSAAKKATLWFNQEIFDGLDEGDEDQMAEINEMHEIGTKKRKNDSAVEPASKKKRTENRLVGPQIPEKEAASDVDDDNEDSEEEEFDAGEYGAGEDEQAPAKKRKRDDFEEVPLGPDVDNYDSDDQAEMLALGKALMDPKKRQKVLDSEINRYSFPEDADSVPSWFKDDEMKHNQPQKPVTKAEILEHKRNLRAIDSTSTQKIAEARARKKKKLMARAEKAKQKARAISASNELPEKEKIRQIQKLYGGSLKQKTKISKVYVVGGKSGKKTLTKNKTQGRTNVKLKLVDKRLKADKRGAVASKRRGERRLKRKNTSKAASKAKKRASADN